MKRLTACIAVFALVLGLTMGLILSHTQDALAAVIIKIAGMKPEGEPETISMHKFGEYLKKLSNGKYEVKVYPNSILGKEDSYIAQTRKGIIQMCATGTQTSALHPAMAMLETPMLFDSYAHARKAMDGGPTFELINKGFPEKSGLRTMNAFPLGFRHFYTKKPLKDVKDLLGLRLRVPNIPLYIRFAKECGISGQAMPFAEVHGALDQGIIDGGDSPLADIVSKKMYEITPEITLTGHILVIHSLYINKKFYDNLPEQDKKWFDEAAKLAADYVWKEMEKIDSEAEKTILANKGHITQPNEAFRAHMKNAAEKTWNLFRETVPNCQEILDSAAALK
ncbi:MAG: TRAP transporter substrate-binding protein [Desulfovibrionaceae bacterium]|nr:TRAP transporter substrate-binding protein [Desulfovibrionaceae bacterium]